ncbi:MAG: hypothetical protein HQ513_17560 [Rhodospirillales bacterium]|nr:hypothetical protein [Rhodospirillales bacterium]
MKTTSDGHFNVLLRAPTDIIPHLARGELHWKKGYSACELATSWVSAGDIPANVRTVLDQNFVYENARFVEGFFERSVDLRTPGFPSETDLMVIVATADGLAVIGVEGKVEEPLGPLVDDWLRADDRGHENRRRRLESLCATLGLDAEQVGDLRYQLLHRTASTVYEAQRYMAAHALMLVHSFSQKNSWFEDFAAFADGMGQPVQEPGQMSSVKTCEGVGLALAWVKDEPAP